MGLKIQQRIALKGKTITLLIAAFALVAQPLYGYVSAQIVKAATITDRIVINEIMAKPALTDVEWIELYNPNNYSVGIGGWKVKTGNSTFANLSNEASIEPHGYFVVNQTTGGENLSNSGQTIELLGKTGNVSIDTVTYTGVKEGKTYARTYDAASTWVAQAAPTKNASNGSAPAVIPAKTPLITAENFNTNQDSVYEGVSVGFNVKDFEAVKSVVVKLIRADGSVVTKTAGPAVLNIINDDGKEILTTPFVIKAGTLTEANDTDGQGNLYWNPASSAVWSDATTPTNAIVEVINGDNALHMLDFSAAGKSFSEPDGVTYASIAPAVPPVQVAETVRANTASAENAPGWLFNRDVTTSTPYQFKSGVHSIGSGSLYVEPIGSANPKDKFIGELYAKTAVSDFSGLSYDFKIAGSGTAASAEHFYTSVYVNTENDNKFYDCRFDYAPLTGSTAAFTNYAFNKDTAPVQVARSGTSRVIGSCPATMAGMPAGSHVRVMAINVGQSTASDAGIAGYLDNIVFSTKTKVMTYDFEADTVAPSAPTNGAPHTTYERDNDFYFTWSNSTDDLSAVTYEFQSSTTDSTDGDGSLVGAWNSQRDGNSEQKHLASPTIHSTGAPDGKYYWQVRAIDAAGNKSPWSTVWNMTIDSKAPQSPTNLGLKVTTSGLAVPNNGFTNQSGVTATWASNNTEQVTYVYKYWNNVATSQYKENTPWSNPLTSTSYSGVVNEGEGRHFVCVVAVDLAGNESACGAVFGFTYDTTAPDAAVSGVVAGQSVTGDVSLKGSVIDVNPMNTYFVVTGPNSYSQSSFYGDGRAVHEYLWKTDALANGTYKVQFETRDRAGNKDSGSVVSMLVTVNNPQPVVMGENFNTHSGTDYKGVNVGFNIAAFKTVTTVSVSLYDDQDNLLVTNTHNDNLLDLIASGVTQLSTPFITDQGTYTEEYWNMGERAWKANEKPAKAVILVSGTNNTGVAVSESEELTLLSEPNDWTFASLMPVVIGVLPPPTETSVPNNSNNNNATANSTTSGSTFSALPLANVRTPANVFLAQLGGNDEVAVPDDAAVLGAQSNADDAEVKGVRDLTVAAIDSENSVSALFGLAWYWWLVIAAIFATILFTFARRRSQDI